MIGLQPKVVYDRPKRKERAHSNSLSECDWNSGKNKTLLDSAIKSSLFESVIESISLLNARKLSNIILTG